MTLRHRQLRKLVNSGSGWAACVRRVLSKDGSERTGTRLLSNMAAEVQPVKKALSKNLMAMKVLYRNVPCIPS